MCSPKSVPVDGVEPPSSFNATSERCGVSIDVRDDRPPQSDNRDVLTYKLTGIKGIVGLEPT